MPIPKAYADTVLSSFRDKAKECIIKGFSGPAFNDMIHALNRMEQLAHDLDNFSEFSKLIMQENLQLRFRKSYSQIFVPVKKVEDDEKKLLQLALIPFEDAVKKFEKAIQDHTLNGKESVKLSIKNKFVTSILKKSIVLGKSSDTLPEFLTQITKNEWDKAINGHIAIRSYIQDELELSEIMDTPPVINKNIERLVAFDEIADNSPYRITDPIEFYLAEEVIEWKWAPEIHKWNHILRQIKKIFKTLEDWIDSYSYFAVHDYRWTVAGNINKTRRNIRKTQGCNPGIFKERLRILDECFGISWRDVEHHEVFTYWRNSDGFPYTPERVQLLIDASEFCVIENGKISVVSGTDQMQEIMEHMVLEASTEEMVAMAATLGELESSSENDMKDLSEFIVKNEYLYDHNLIHNIKREKYLKIVEKKCRQIYGEELCEKLLDF